MPNMLEISIYQKETLYDLLKLKAATEKAGISLKELDELILRQETKMQQEDISFVRQQIEKLQKLCS
jgi:cupin superfamily acireductone dioxygenase involved in methionine salvage